MGNIVKVSCVCGFEDELFVGVGFGDSEIALLALKERGSMNPLQNFRLNVKARRFSRTQRQATERTKRILSSDVIEEALSLTHEIDFHCPYCDRNRMTVGVVGHWD